MKNKRHLAVGKRGISLTALALAACMLLSLAGTDIGQARAVDLNEACTLTVAPGPEGLMTDLKEANVVIDLYKVADAKTVSGYDTYTFKPAGAYAGLDSVRALEDMTTVTNEDYQAIAQEAAALTLTTEGTTIARAVDGQPVGSPILELVNGQKLGSGLYLLIARGADLTDPADYLKEISVEENGQTRTKLATIAHSDEYTYTFEPELIALPSRMVLNEDGTISNETSNNDTPWQYDLAVTLKPEQALRFGVLEIVKNLPVYEADGAATFVFRVEAWQDEARTKLLYSGVHVMSFTDAGSQRIRIENRIPVGAYVEVSEEYPGPDYRVQGDAVQTAVIPAPDNGDVASVSYTNVYQGTATHGGAITNHFEYNAEGGNAGWNWTQQ